MNELIRKYGVQTLKAIMKRKNRARYSEILEDFPATSGTLSRVLKVLEQEGYISREIDPNSRPPTAYYSVTEKGTQVVKREADEVLTALYSSAKTEKDQKVIEEIRERLKKYGL